MDTIEWAACVLDCEGAITVGPPSSPTLVALKVDMSDRDMLERFVAVVGVGDVRPTRSSNPLRGKRPQWRWQVSNRRSVGAVLAMFYPTLSDRRQAQADAALALIASIEDAGGR
jgi:hypothetical protein